MLKKLFVSYLFVLILASQFTLYSQEIIKINKSNGTYTVPCKVNGLKLDFIFDTGASDVSISLSEANFMLKNGYLKKNDLKGASYYQIANGDIVEGTTILIRELEIGNKKIYDVEASIVHSLSAPLLLGQSALRRFGRFTFDYSANTLILGGTSNSVTYNTTEQQPQNVPYIAVSKKITADAMKRAKKSFSRYLESYYLNTKSKDAELVKTEMKIGDFTGDGVEDIAMWFTWTEPYVEVPEAFFYEIINDRPYLVAEYKNESYWFDIVKIENGHIYITTTNYGEDDPRCCPSIEQNLVLKHTNNQFIQY